MKIDNIVSGLGGSPASTRTISQSRVAMEAPSSSSDKIEQVALSSLSSRLAQANEAMAATPTVDANRVAEIKQAITEGRFHINPERIANGLLEDVRQMLTKQ